MQRKQTPSGQWYVYCPPAAPAWTQSSCSCNVLPPPPPLLADLLVRCAVPVAIFQHKSSHHTRTLRSQQRRSPAQLPGAPARQTTRVHQQLQCNGTLGHRRHPFQGGAPGAMLRLDPQSDGGGTPERNDGWGGGGRGCTFNCQLCQETKSQLGPGLACGLFLPRRNSVAAECQTFGFHQRKGWERGVGDECLSPCAFPQVTVAYAFGVMHSIRI